MITSDTDATLERARLVRLCTRLTGDPEAAEDLAQETLLEGWRLIARLQNESGRFPWLAAIARNLCRRWARHRQTELNRLLLMNDGLECDARGSLSDIDKADVEVEFERHELAQLLARALALIPPETGQALIERYILDSSHAEIAARLGVSADAVGMRLHRGKLRLRRLLTQELHAEAVAFGLCDPGDADWEETRIWCMICGKRHLLGRFECPDGRLAFRCPGCAPGPSVTLTEYRLANPTYSRLFAGLSRYRPILNRALSWADGYFRSGLASGAVTCTDCGELTPLLRMPPVSGGSADPLPRFVARCAACGEVSSTSLTGIVLTLSAVRRFWRQYPRLRTLPVREVNSFSRAALLIRVESVSEPAGLDVLIDRETYAILGVRADGTGAARA